MSTSVSNCDLSHISVLKKLSSSKFPVYLAVDTSNGQQVAIKSFPPGHNLYLKEKDILMTLQHPHIVRFFEAIENSTLIQEERSSLIGLEYAPYGDLMDIISSYGRIPETLTRTLFHQLIDALSYMHNNEIVHLDLKVDNLLIDENLQLKVTDFDLSQDARSTKLDARGTPGCRAPEVKQGICEDLRAADVYSAGIVLFTMLSGNPPYNEVSKGYQLEFDGFYRAMRQQNKRFWEVHAKHRGDANFYSEEFRDLIGRILEENSGRRATIEEIKRSAWFNGPVLDKDNYKAEMKKYLKQDEEIQ